MSNFRSFHPCIPKIMHRNLPRMAAHSLLPVTEWKLVIIYSWVPSLIARFMGPTWGPSGADRTQVGPMLAPWTLLSGFIRCSNTLRWRHNVRDSDSNHQPHGCLLNRLFRRRSRKTSKLRVTGLCVGNSPWTGEFPAQMSSYVENVSIWWRHHDILI